MANVDGRYLGDRARLLRPLVWSGAAALMLLPLVAMRLTDAVRWTGVDFAFLAAMLAAICGALELVTRKTRDTSYRMATGIAVMGMVMLVWINGAVGIIGSERNPANLMFGGVIAVGVIGAPVARFRAAGMARASVAMAGAQALVGMIALGAGLGEGEVSWPWDVIFATGLFCPLWLVSAWLFGRAAGGPSAIA